MVPRIRNIISALKNHALGSFVSKRPMFSGLSEVALTCWVAVVDWSSGGEETPVGFDGAAGGFISSRVTSVGWSPTGIIFGSDKDVQ